MLHQEISKVQNQTIKTTMIYIGLITAKVIFCHVVGCTIGVYNFILRKSNTVLKKTLNIPKNKPFSQKIRIKQERFEPENLQRIKLLSLIKILLILIKKCKIIS